MPVFLLSEKEVLFPPPQLSRKDGLLAVGGDLSCERLLQAYRMGIFPWYLEGEPILWWSPDPRMVLFPQKLHVPRRLERLIRRQTFRVSLDQAFDAVIRECAQTHRRKDRGTWIVREMIDAYSRLHQEGYAHSLEVWSGSSLAGGLYGVSLGNAFFGESMFTRSRDASKVGLVFLAKALQATGFSMLDCQVASAHLTTFGACEISRRDFLKRLSEAVTHPTLKGQWVVGADPREPIRCLQPKQDGLLQTR